MKYLDVIIIGGGNAGIEASLILKKLKKNIILITNNIDNIGNLSCNPSIGGIGKSNLIKEIDSLGGYIYYFAKKSYIQKNFLNFSRGESNKSIRFQIDRNLYKKTIKNLIKKKKLKIIQDVVKKILIKNNKIIGVKTNYNTNYYSKIIIITTGTFLNSKIFIGKKLYKGGRLNENIKSYLSEQLKNLGLNKNRLKTGTPPRINNNINFNKIIKQKSNLFNINFKNKNKIFKNLNCWITKTNKKTHDIIKKNLKYSPLYNNLISGIGPRYCPSIEDKIYRFYKKNYHQIFLEPENKNCTEFYPSGISTSLPFFIQKKLINSIEGLEKTLITRPGYSVEYDFFNPKDLKYSLESNFLDGLFLAGQINGTTGYEEAAAQGLIAGINSNFKIEGKNYWKPNKNNSFIGLMISDLINKGVIEPYRILSNKPNFKLKINEENSYIRLSKFFIKNFDKKKFFKLKIFKKIFIKKINNYKKFIKNYKNLFLIKINKKLITKIINLYIKIYFKYKNYLIKEHEDLKKTKKFLNYKIPKINFFKIKNLSREEAEKLNIYKPKNINEITLIPNINKKSINYIIKIIKNTKI